MESEGERSEGIVVVKVRVKVIGAMAFRMWWGQRFVCSQGSRGSEL